MTKIDPTSAVIGGLSAALLTALVCFIGWLGFQVIGGTYTSLNAHVDQLDKLARQKFDDHEARLKALEGKPAHSVVPSIK